MAEDFEKQQTDKKSKKEVIAEEQVPKVKDMPDDPRRKVSDIDYQKFEKLSKDLDREEEIKKFQAELEKGERPPMGCSHNHRKEREIFEKSTDEKIKAADRFREEGNAAYKEENYGLACVHYRRGLLQFDYTFPETPELQRKADKVKTKCHLNLAAAKMASAEYDEVLTHARLALELEPNNVKAYYRRAMAYLKQDEYDDAHEAFDNAHSIDPDNQEVIKGMHLLAKMKKEYREKRRKISAAIEKDRKKNVSGIERSTSSNTEQKIDPRSIEEIKNECVQCEILLEKMSEMENPNSATMDKLERTIALGRQAIQDKIRAERPVTEEEKVAAQNVRNFLEEQIASSGHEIGQQQQNTPHIEEVFEEEEAAEPVEEFSVGSVNMSDTAGAEDSGEISMMNQTNQTSNSSEEIDTEEVIGDFSDRDKTDSPKSVARPEEKVSPADFAFPQRVSHKPTENATAPAQTKKKGLPQVVVYAAGIFGLVTALLGAYIVGKMA